MGQTTVYGANTVCCHWKAFGVALSPSLGTLWPCETPPRTLPQPFFSPLAWEAAPPHFTDGEASGRRRRLDGGLSPGPGARGVWLAQHALLGAPSFLCQGLPAPPQPLSPHTPR